MELQVIRKYKKDTYTIGSLYVDGEWFSDTLEDKDRGLKCTMFPEEIRAKKVYGETAIPTGTYEVKMTYSGKFATRSWARKYNGKVPEVLDVKGFAGIRIHPGNSDKDTYGCLLIGRNTVKGKVTQSVDYYYKLLDNYIVPALKRGDKVMLNIK